MANSIYEIVTAKNLRTYWDVAKQYREPFYGETKFPSKKQLGLELSWIKGARNAPVALMPSTFDAKVIKLSRQGLEINKAKMPFFKNSLDIDEEQRQKLNTLLMTGNQEMIDTIMTEIFNDDMHLLENADLTREMMRMQALTTGVVSISGNGVSETYDYGVPASHKITPSVKWDVPATAAPVNDIDNALNLIENDTGVRPNEILLNSTTLNAMGKVASIKNAVYVFADGKVNVTRQKVVAYLESELDVKVTVYNKGYQDASGNFVKFVPDGTVVLLPDNINLGNTHFGTTPEESDLMTGATDAQVEIVDTGVALTTMKEKDPVTVITKASMICLPSFEQADKVAILSVFTE